MGGVNAGIRELKNLKFLTRDSKDSGILESFCKDSKDPRWDSKDFDKIPKIPEIPKIILRFQRLFWDSNDSDKTSKISDKILKIPKRLQRFW